MAIWHLHQRHLDVVPSVFLILHQGRLSLLADHQNFLVYPLGCSLALARAGISPAAAGIGLSSGAIAFTGSPASASVLITRHCPGCRSPTGCAPLRATNLFDFHPEVFMLPFFLFAAWLLQEKPRPAVLGFFCLLAPSPEESAGRWPAGSGWLALGPGPRPPAAFTRWLGLGV